MLSYCRASCGLCSAASAGVFPDGLSNPLFPSGAPIGANPFGLQSFDTLDQFGNGAGKCLLCCELNYPLMGCASSSILLLLTKSLLLPGLGLQPSSFHTPANPFLASVFEKVCFS